MTIQMKAVEQYFHVVLFIMLSKIIETLLKVWPVVVHVVLFILL